jgi:hypothetical protein
MRRFTAFLALAAGLASAAPLVGTRASVAEGRFCQTYGCALVERSVNLPETLNLIGYRYAVIGGELVVGRVGGTDIYAASLTLPLAMIGSKLVRDFAVSMQGEAFDSAALKRCLALAQVGQLPRSFGHLTIRTGPIYPNDVLGVTTTCERLPGNRVRLSIDDAGFEPR